jgi:DNA-binding response OmpR family regulator
MSKKIFIVDDNIGILEGFQTMLEGEGYEVTASLHIDIISPLKQDNLPDLIILDVLLSGVDGRDICKQIKNTNMTKHIPIIMVSAHPNARKTSIESGADDFISKPFEMEELLTKVRNLMYN